MTIQSVTIGHAARFDSLATRMLNDGEIGCGERKLVGHIRLGVLPNTRKWREVIELLERDAPIDRVVATSAEAAERQFLAAADDPVFVEVVRLLAVIPNAAKADDFAGALRELGLPVGDAPDLAQIVTATGDRLDRFQRERQMSSDFGELSRRALLSTLSSRIGAELPGLFEATPAEVRAAAAGFAASRRFAVLARSFFARLLSTSLSSFLDRALSAHVGAGRRFADMAARSAFDDALDQYCAEATRIIREFSGGWYGKTLHREGEISRGSAAAFGAVAFRKITDELRRKRGGDG